MSKWVLRKGHELEIGRIMFGLQTPIRDSSPLQTSRLERGIKLNTEHHPVPGLGMSGATLPTFPTPSWCKQG